MLICGKYVHEFETICVQIGNTTTMYLSNIILGLGTYFFSFNTLYNKKRAMRHIMRNPRELKVRNYALRMVELIEYLAIFSDAQESEEIRETELNEIIFHTTPNGWISQCEMHGFYFEAVTFKKNINIFGNIEIAENI